MKMAVFWVVRPCSLLEVYQTTRLHGVATQKTTIFILSAVRTSNPTKIVDGRIFIEIYDVIRETK
jgi:hypothetical protein